MKLFTLIRHYEKLIRTCIKRPGVTKFGTTTTIVRTKYSPSDYALPKNRSSNSNTESTEPIDAGAYLLLIIPISTFGLGTWQIFRWRSKLQQIANLDERTLAEPIDLPQDLSELDSLEYRRVKLKGKFNYDEEVLIGPRSLQKDGPSSPKTGLITRVNNDSGYNLITPFDVSGRDVAILINRGWIASRKDVKHDSVPSNQEVEIVAVVRKNEQRPTFVSKDSGSPNLYLYRDISRIAQHLGTNELFMDLNSINGVDLSKTLPIPAQTRVSLRNEHVQYICTWYALSIITSIMWRRLFVLRKPLI